MKKITCIILVLLMLALSTPANAAREVPTVGDRICIHPLCDPPPPTAFPAGAPFFIRHGWQWSNTGNQAIGRWDFYLIVDGTPVQNGFPYIDPPKDDLPGSIVKIYNFPDGLPAGVHTLEGIWTIACQYGPDPSACTTPNEPVIVIENTVTITFTEP
jgi:hypothetical protein